MTLELAPELEAALRALAETEGVEPERYALRLVQEGVRHHTACPVRLPREEAILLEQLNQGLAPEMWQRYHELIAKRRAETLTPDEQATLIRMSDEIEAWNVRRLSLLIELARLRNLPVPKLMEDLGLRAPSDA
jgi:hypothetical protein